MKDYSAMSDDEIASDVLLALGYKMVAEGYSYGIFLSDNGRKDTGSKASSEFKFDPCNNPADAWPIIVEGGIGVMPFKSDHARAWDSSRGLAGDRICHHANPLRAAMTVYLMMKDAEKCDG